MAADSFSRVQRILGVVEIVFGSLGVFVGSGLLLAFVLFPVADAEMARRGLGGGGDIPVFSPALAALTGAVTLVSALTIIGGRGLLRGRPWAWRLLIAVSILHLALFPVGTAVGCWALWTLANSAKT